ncbi:MAG: TIGR04283 family arsenosugar biosynthesis glycosyltransferase [Flavobacteriales bacterium]
MINKISIIIPTLNEADNIGHLLWYLVTNYSKNNIADIIISDGGSKDETVALVAQFSEKHPFVSAIASEKGRAKQMNNGAKQATGSILYFLHADSFPPKNFDQYIINEVKKGNLAGCFKMKFDNQHWWLQLASWLTHFRWRACRGGDQSQFITKTLFEEIGAFDENYIIYEDNILINELYKRNQFVVIQHWIVTSARLYEKIGIWKLQYYFWAIYVKRWFGASADEIYNYYLKKIAVLK